eukprot:TRINITY_DN8884_c0_g1_i1.p1 TRINITY_DN8884_c0_g1~~TRINITY_DN8884_c0_g1_i1.p1  ORF type:complete len:586 (-),score=100.26 TRINITY_DN8884_c0_g1_i1:19-1776(-)
MMGLDLQVRSAFLLFTICLCVCDFYNAAPYYLTASEAQVELGLAYSDNNQANALMGDNEGVSASVDFLAVGLKSAQGVSVASGCVDVLARQTPYSTFQGGWKFIQRIFPSDGRSGDLFGFAVALDADVIAVGAPQHQGVGAVYTYFLNKTSGSTPPQFGNEQKLMQKDVATGGSFGSSVVLHGSWLAVGAPQIGNGKGLVELFSRQGDTNWVPSSYLNDALEISSVQFGRSLSLYQTKIAVSLLRDSGAIGAIYTYFPSSPTIWRREQVILHPFDIEQDGFGQCISLYQDVLMVGAPASISGNKVAGLVYVFNKVNNQWQLNATIAPQSNFPSQFAYSISLYGSTASISSFGNAANNEEGAVYVYNSYRGVWTFAKALTLNGKPTAGSFGTKTVITPHIVAASSPKGVDSSSTSGIVYQYDSRVFTQVTFWVDVSFNSLDPASFTNSLISNYQLDVWQLETISKVDKPVRLLLRVLSGTESSGEQSADRFVQDVGVGTDYMKTLKVLQIMKEDEGVVHFGSIVPPPPTEEESSGSPRVTIVIATVASILSVIMVIVGFNYYVNRRSRIREGFYYSADGGEYRRHL